MVCLMLRLGRSVSLSLAQPLPNLISSPCGKALGGSDRQTTDAKDELVYHIHDQPVPSDGNCTKTLAHQDPTERGEIPPCDPSAPETCQVGDLAGKHGNITSNPFQVA